MLILVDAMLTGLVVGVSLGWAVGFSMGRSVTHAEMNSTEVPGLRHTIDHRCEPPFSHWSTVDDSWCFVDVEEYGSRIKPGDVWVCPCLRSWVAHDGMWRPEPNELVDGA